MEYIHVRLMCLAIRIYFWKRVLPRRECDWLDFTPQKLEDWGIW